MVWIVVGWVVWSLTALMALFYILRAFSPGSESWINKDINTKAFLLTAIALTTVLTDISKLHTLWAVPVVFILCMAIFAAKMTRAQGQMKRNIDELCARVQRESAKTGEPVDDIIKRESERMRSGQ